MGRIFINKVNESQVQAIVQAELALNPPSSQTPRYSSAPSSPTLGDKYYNTVSNREYIYNPIGWEQVDTKDGTELQDLSGNIVLID